MGLIKKICHKSETRWSNKIDAVKIPITNLSEIHDALYEISNGLSYDQNAQYV